MYRCFFVKRKIVGPVGSPKYSDLSRGHPKHGSYWGKEILYFKGSCFGFTFVLGIYFRPKRNRTQTKTVHDLNSPEKISKNEKSRWWISFLHGAFKGYLVVLPWILWGTDSIWLTQLLSLIGILATAEAEKRFVSVIFTTSQSVMIWEYDYCLIPRVKQK